MNTLNPEITAVAEIQHFGEKLILPEGMSMDQAIDLIQRRKKYLEETVVIDETFDVFPWDGANALANTLIRRYGWVPAEATRSFFGDEPPKLITINVGYKKKGTVPWGKFSLPGISGMLTTATGEANGRIAFRLHAKIKRLHEQDIRNLFQEIRDYLKEHSIYRGQAIKIRFLDEQGEQISMPEPEFLNPHAVKPEDLIYSEDVMQAVKTNLFTPIQRVHDCAKNGISVKRGVLLGGTFGTGKTLAATVASYYATENGLVYVYCPRADELNHAIKFAQQYANPAAVVFCEDIDREIGGTARTVKIDDILNVIDGIDTKGANIITVLTTNDLEAITPAMLRPGRLDAVIEVTPPDANAIERLVRHYGGEAINENQDLTEVGIALSGRIPAVIAEVVKRAKLSQLGLQEPGTMVTNLTNKALLDAAFSMNQQLDLLYRDREVVPPALETAFKSLIRQAVNDEQLPHLTREIRERV